MGLRQDVRHSHLEANQARRKVAADSERVATSELVESGGKDRNESLLRKG